ncbi:MAG: ORF6N domain-containing protein [Bacteroidetes bacterium]|nr:MAG: ORF6N domain-containing protein [Bacteroidota bacterium]
MSKIYMLRGQSIMLDRDLAELYGVKTIRLRQQVSRNTDRFPDNFMFRLTHEEVELMVSQNAIPSIQHLGGSLPYAFTEHGVLMLASVLRSGRAIQMSIRIIEVFVQMREMIMMHADLFTKLKDIEQHITTHDEHIIDLYEHLKNLLKDKHEREELDKRKRIGFNK